MRRLTDPLSPELAIRLHHYLQSEGVGTHLDEEGQDGITVWVLDDSHLTVARQEAEMFLTDPTNPKYQVARPRPKKEKKTPRHRVIDARTEVFHRSQGSGGLGLWTTVIVLLCVGATLVSRQAELEQWTRLLYFSEYMSRSFPEIMGGEVWRLITPIFLHAGWMHLIFNMLWLVQLGSMIENNQGSLFFLGFVLITAVICNTSQYLVSGPAFVGLSGVVYAMLGYTWQMSKYQPRSNYFIHPQTVVFMVVWLLICLVGIIPNIANTQHVMGLFSGTLAGWIHSGGAKLWIRQRLR